MLFQSTYTWDRLVKIFLPAESWLVNSNFGRASRMQGPILVPSATRLECLMHCARNFYSLGYGHWVWCFKMWKLEKILKPEAEQSHDMISDDHFLSFWSRGKKILFSFMARSCKMSVAHPPAISFPSLVFLSDEQGQRELWEQDWSADCDDEPCKSPNEESSSLMVKYVFKRLKLYTLVPRK